jgi:hypothetical protein
MAVWTCPECQRQFRRRGQSHECAPALSIEEYFATGQPFERVVFDAVARHLDGVGAVKIEPLSVGIMFKRASTFAQLRPKRDRVELAFMLSRPLKHARIRKTWHGKGLRWAYFVDLRTSADVDEDITDWLTEAYLTSPD